MSSSSLLNDSSKLRNGGSDGASNVGNPVEIQWTTLYICATTQKNHAFAFIVKVLSKDSSCIINLPKQSLTLAHERSLWTTAKLMEIPRYLEFMVFPMDKTVWYSLWFFRSSVV